MTTATVPADTDAAAPAGQVWAALAPLMAARPTMRLWSPQSRFLHTRRLTTKLPTAPAAVPIYTRNHTRLLVFDLDAKHAGNYAVAADTARILSWLDRAGARAVVDDSASGGVHVLVPLDQATHADTVRELLTAAATRCPSLDTTPMLNTSTGCITAPGSPCREGGHRRLRGPLAAAVDTFTRPNPADVVARLSRLLTPPATDSPAEPVERPDISTGLFSGTGADAALREQYRRNDPLPIAVAAFAQTGRLEPLRRWPSRSEARMSVLCHLMWRGTTLADLRVLLAPTGPWADGLGRAYARYGRRQDTAVAADWAAARRWIEAVIPRVQSGTHKKQEHTGGSPGAPAGAPQQRWLADALHWCDVALRSSVQRWSVAAVLQGLAVCSWRAGELVNGVPVVAVGGRSLSIAAGLISESSVWSALRLLRETPGSPLLLVARGSGITADRYALVTPDITDWHPHAPGRPQVVDVDPVWSVLGMQYRRVYEVVHAGAMSVNEVSVAARISRSSAYDAVAELCRLGLVSRRAGGIRLGEVELRDLAERYRVAELRAERIREHQHQRSRWRQWLSTRQNPVVEPDVTIQDAPDPATVCGGPHGDDVERQDYLRSVLATGPPALVVA